MREELLLPARDHSRHQINESASTDAISLLSIVQDSQLPNRLQGSGDKSANQYEVRQALGPPPAIPVDDPKLQEQSKKNMAQSDKFFRGANCRPHPLTKEERQAWLAQARILRGQLDVLRKIDPQGTSVDSGKTFARLGVAEMLLSGDGGCEQANKYFQKAIKALIDGPPEELAFAFAGKGRNLMQMGNQEDAEKALLKAQEAIVQSPLRNKRENGLIHLDLAIVNARRGLWEHVEDDAATARSILRHNSPSKDDKELCQSLILLADAKRYQKKDGSEEFNEYIERFGKHLSPSELCSVHFRKAENYVALGKLAESKNAYMDSYRAIEGSTVDSKELVAFMKSENLAGIGRVELKLDRADGAEFYLGKAIEQWKEAHGERPVFLEQLADLQLDYYKAIAAQRKNTADAVKQVMATFDTELRALRTDKRLGPNHISVMWALMRYKEALISMKQTKQLAEIDAEIARIKALHESKKE
jgi:tetratricopeptide (TPR) repeat protein